MCVVSATFVLCIFLCGVLCLMSSVSVCVFLSVCLCVVWLTVGVEGVMSCGI